MTRITRGADIALLALAAILPFQPTSAAFSLGGIRFTSVEIALCISLAMGGVALAADPERRSRVLTSIPLSWALLLGAFALCALVSALAAPAFEGTSLKAGARTAAGLALVPLGLAALKTQRDLATLAFAVSAGAVASAAIGLTQAGFADDFDWLELFRPEDTYQGAIRRLSGPFDHANIAAMFFEASIPLLAVLVWLAWRGRRRVWTAIGLVLLAALVEALVLTYSRGGIAALVASNAIAAALVAGGRAGNLRRALVPAGAVAVLAVVAFSMSVAVSPTVRTAIRRESPQDPLHESPPARTASAPPVVPRGDLWGVAVHFVRERPLLGSGLDTFRLTYGPELGLRRWDTRQHSNSLYLETLVSLGVVGAVAFFGWLLVLLLDIGRTLLRASDPWTAAIAAALLAYLLHGIVDYFLLFSSTGLLFWLLSGAWLAARRAPA
jgi:O-antigen ligase